jgi:hypothetical protein
MNQLVSHWLESRSVRRRTVLHHFWLSEDRVRSRLICRKSRKTQGLAQAAPWAVQAPWIRTQTGASDFHQARLLPNHAQHRAIAHGTSGPQIDSPVNCGAPLNGGRLSDLPRQHDLLRQHRIES